jgi:surface protein
MKNEFFLFLSSIFKSNKTRPKIIAENKEHLRGLIATEYKLYGKNCNLNHIDVSNVISMENLFFFSSFNGDISEWDVSNVRNMKGMFAESSFNGDISKWNVSNVENMYEMFYDSQFQGDISKWDVSKVFTMEKMFHLSSYKGNLTEWKPYSLEFSDMNLYGNNKPYWLSYKDTIERNRAINSYHLNEELTQELTNHNATQKKMKI